MKTILVKYRILDYESIPTPTPTPTSTPTPIPIPTPTPTSIPIPIPIPTPTPILFQINFDESKAIQAKYYRLSTGNTIYIRCYCNPENHRPIHLYCNYLYRHVTCIEDY